MSEAARKAQSDRMKARHAATAAAKAAGGGVAVMEREPEIMSPDGAPISDAGARRVSQSERFAARIRAQAPLTTTDDLERLAGDDADILERGGGSNVEHTSAGLVWMFKRENWGWRRGKFSRNDVAMLLNAGFLDRCGDCGSPDCAGKPNSCPVGKKRMYRDCPVAGCNDGRGKRFYDMIDYKVRKSDSDDPFAIKDSVYEESTPELRTKAQLDEHIRYYHTAEAAVRGLTLVRTA